jgi:outer membrane receptor protein involved in Fe transport
MFNRACVTLLLLLSYHIAFSQKDSISVFDLSLEQLMELEAHVASHVEKDIKKQPVSIISISRKQLELSGARTLADALSIYIPGFFIVEDQDDVIAGFRGLAPDNNSKVMLMINGQNLNIEWFWGPPAAILNTTNFDFIEKVEVIRGPGSVTQGQSALLGVINIVTKSARSATDRDKIVAGSARTQIGLDNHLGINGDIMFSDNKKSGYLFIGARRYNGQSLRNEGWAKDKNNEGYQGGTISQIGTRLKRSSNSLLMGNFQSNGFDFNFLVVDHKQDLYNFYRDRNQFGEQLIMVSPSYSHSFNENFGINISLNGAIDNFSLRSVDGYTMGGTRENRYGGKVLLNYNEIIPGNRLAIGAEFRRFEFGRNNFSGNNFINNVITNEVINDEEAFIDKANQEKVWGYKSNINVISFFAEDYLTVGNYLELFSGVRFDQHPYWGGNFSPRIGMLVIPNPKLRLRFSYQTGFRGAVGLHYGGGYRQDGLLSEANFDKVSSVQIPIFDSEDNIVGYEENITNTLPESMHGFEFAIDYDLNQHFNLYGVGFYNIITNVIDVGVIWRNPLLYNIPSVGSDVPGDWNGYWFFKNTEGEIEQAGFEAIVSYRNKNLTANISHSLVSVISSSDQQRGSMYLTDDGNFKAYPENVTRLNLISSITKDLSVGFNYLYYYKWFSPGDQMVKANHLINLSLSYEFFKNFNLSASCVNLLNQTALYPMNSNVGDANMSDGTPSVEKITFWGSLGYKF